MTLTTDTILIKMLELCKLQAQIDSIKAELEPFMTEGETFACELGKLTKTKAPETFVPNAEGKRQLDAFKDRLLGEGLGKISMGKPSLRLTLNKYANS